MFIVGLTGGIGSGKSTVSECFEKFDIVVVDADILAREVVEPGTPSLVAISDKFGNNILDEGGGLNRAKLREIVFADSTKKTWLEKLLHPAIRDLMLSRLQTSPSPYTLLVSPLLLETDQHKLADRILVVDVPVEIQLKRTLKRDGSNEATIQSIIDSQIGRAERLAAADDILSNDQSSDKLPAKVLSLHNKYLELSRTSI
ncbi:MAG: dephospho-CoA kinase [Pseudohongiellaceae bacterium]|jgi:dephospho-CoA kinase